MIKFNELPIILLVKQATPITTVVQILLLQQIVNEVFPNP
jgi:hypothetical protein